MLARLFYSHSLTDLNALSQLRDELGNMQQLNLAMRTFVRGLTAHSRKRNHPVMLDTAPLP